MAFSWPRTLRRRYYEVVQGGDSSRPFTPIFASAFWMVHLGSGPATISSACPKDELPSPLKALREQLVPGAAALDADFTSFSGYTPLVLPETVRPRADGAADPRRVDSAGTFLRGVIRLILLGRAWDWWRRGIPAVRHLVDPGCRCWRCLCLERVFPRAAAREALAICPHGWPNGGGGGPRPRCRWAWPWPWSHHHRQDELTGCLPHLRAVHRRGGPRQPVSCRWG